ncbi:hypothetical protein OE88DRAFT_366095 [Heliocybe sulcata]|uniref:Uncharacterized protein n=1 Tax=Heliocybe sulcata TaxID=5364 RepID=A0A5C3MXM2_9AGAM|nr:hypothetical protein OE88DRAFT_366095 [Heliocybe sulcata]
MLLRSTRFLTINWSEDRVFILWLFILPPFVWVERVPREKYSLQQCVMRRIRLAPHQWPPIHLENAADERIKHLERKYPSTFQSRSAYAETWPRINRTLFVNARVHRLQHLDGSNEGLQRLREVYMQGLDRRSIILSLLASTTITAMGLPGTDNAHWLARAFWFASSAIAVTGVIMAILTPILFDTFFQEDCEAALHNNAAHKYLTLHTDPVLLHQIDIFIEAYRVASDALCSSVQSF